MNETRLHALDVYDQWSPTAMTNPSSGSSLWNPVRSGSSTTLTIPMKTYTEIRAMGMMVFGAWVRKLRYGGRDHFWMFSCFSALHFFYFWISARYKWRRHGRLPPANGGGVSQWTASAKWSPLSCTDQLWDICVRMIAYVGWLFHSLFPFLSLLWYWLWQPRRSAPEEGDNVTATGDLRPGKRQCILVTTTALRSLPEILLFNLPKDHWSPRFELYTFNFDTLPRLGVHAFTVEITLFWQLKEGSNEM